MIRCHKASAKEAERVVRCTGHVRGSNKNNCGGDRYFVVVGDEMHQFIMCDNHLKQLQERIRQALT